MITPEQARFFARNGCLQLPAPGEVWLSLSDSPELFDDNERLHPRGGLLVASRRWLWSNGVRVLRNGAPVTSVSHGGFTARLEPRAGSNVLSIRGIRRPLWLRVTALTAPSLASQVLLRHALDGSQRRVDLQFEMVGATVRA